MPLDTEQIRSDLNTLWNVVLVLVAVVIGVALYWYGYTYDNLLATVIERGSLYLAYLLAGVFAGIMLFDRYTTDES